MMSRCNVLSYLICFAKIRLILVSYKAKPCEKLSVCLVCASYFGCSVFTLEKILYYYFTFMRAVCTVTLCIM